MKVLLIKDVPGMGTKGQIKEIKDGYALNFLIPKKLAVVADDKTIGKFNAEVQAKKDKDAIREDLIKKTLADLKGDKVTIIAKANEKGHLFKAIHVKDAVKALASKHDLIDETFFPKDFSIKEVGEHTVSLEKYGVKGDISIEVKAE